MSRIYVLYNPIAGNGACGKNINILNDVFAGEDLTYIDYFNMEDSVEDFFNKLEENDKVVLCGGDGTINYFINQLDTDKIENEVFYYPLGSGNDFYNDVTSDKSNKVIALNQYIRNLPYVEVNGMKRRFINAIGYGIDGYCCEEGDRVRLKKPGKPVNYTPIALKGLAYAFHRVNATITLDGEVHKYKNVWMAPALNGRYYGGGMMCAPNQDRINNNNKVTVIVVATRIRLLLLIAFASIFKGDHLKFKSFVKEHKACEVNVKFDRPTALQIDGETVSNVREYSVYRK